MKHSSIIGKFEILSDQDTEYNTTSTKDLEDFEEDPVELKYFIDSKEEASIACRKKANILNFSSIIYANKNFYETFSLEEKDVIGKNYDFLYSDIDLDSFSEDQMEYSRLIKAVRDDQECSVIISLKHNLKNHRDFKLYISYIPHFIGEGESFVKSYGIFSFIKIQNKSASEVEELNRFKSNLILAQNLERRLRIERLLRKVAGAIVSEIRIEELFKNVAKYLCEYLKCDRCLINSFLDGSIKYAVEHHLVEIKKMIDGSPENKEILNKYVLFQNSFHEEFGNKDKKSSVLIIEGIEDDKNMEPIKELCAKFSINSQITVSTVFDNKINGGIYIHQSEKRSWNQEEIEIIEIISEQISVAIERANLIEKLMISNHALVEKTNQLKESLSHEQEMRKVQNEFVTLVSHEFKTPLQIIDGTRELVARKIRNLKISDESLFGALERIRSGIHRMNSLINSTLNLAKIEGNQGKIRVELNKFNFRDLVHEVVEKSQNLAQQKNIEIHCRLNELPESYMGDQKLIDHIISNIVSNAIKYSKNNSDIKIVAKEISENYAIRIIDNGIGIPSEDLSKIGKKFFRASNSSSISGTGIGLYIAKYFIELMGGAFLIESKENVGTSVTIVLRKDSPK